MKKSFWITLIICFILTQVAVISYITVKDSTEIVDNNYIAVFRGETGETVYSTYLYVSKKGKKKTYSYINTTSTSYGYDSTNWDEEITKKGTLKKRKQIYKIAEKNNAYSYVRYEDGNIYSIEEFKEKF